MVDKLRRYLHLFGLFMKFDWYLETAYPANFYLATLGKVVRIFLVLVFFKTVSIAVPNIPEWSEPALYLLAATFYITDLLASVFFHRNVLFHLPEFIRTGELDRLLVQPVSTLFHMAFHRIDLGDFMAFLPFAYFWYYIITHFDLPITAPSLLLYIGLTINAVIFIFALVLLLGALSFWTIQGDGFGRLIDAVSGAARFPLDIFPRHIKIIVFYIFPLVILSTLPVQALLGFATVGDIIYSVLFTIALCVISIIVWNMGLRRYHSASS